MISSRIEFPKLLNELNLVGSGVEVGVFKGEFSEVILDSWKGQKLYLVDVWRPMENYIDSSNQKDMNKAAMCLLQTFQRTFSYKDRAVLIREESVKAADFFKDGSLDFVYIDAAHDYDAVMKDMNAWFSKVKKGGLFCGHDYTDMSADENPWGEFKVKKAVDEFAAERKLKVTSTSNDGLFPSWFIQI